MTTLIWDGQHFAADRGTLQGNNTYQRTQKLFGPFDLHPNVVLTLGIPPRRYMAAFCGSLAHIATFRRWLMQPAVGSYRHLAELPDPSHDIGLLLDFGEGGRIPRVYNLFGNGECDEMQNRYAALGSGCDIAIGALAAGADAKKTMRIVAEHSISAVYDFDCFDTKTGIMLHYVNGLAMEQRGLDSAYAPTSHFKEIP